MGLTTFLKTNYIISLQYLIRMIYWDRYKHFENTSNEIHFRTIRIQKITKEFKLRNVSVTYLDFNCKIINLQDEIHGAGIEILLNK